MKKDNRFLLFLRRNALYLVLSLCILAVALSIVLMMVNKQNEQVSTDNPPEVINPVQPEQPSDPVVDPTETPSQPADAPMVFAMPVEQVISIGEYSETMVFNSTLGRFSTHKGIDFFAVEGTAVMAVYDGEVVKVDNSLLTGITITIDHGNGLFTVYNSLADGDRVNVGQKVKKGEVIGEVSVSNRQEYSSGAHLHFEVIENGQNIDPAKYLVMDEK